MATIQIDAERCQKCGTCVQICPNIFTQDAARTVPYLLDTSHCIEPEFGIRKGGGIKLERITYLDQPLLPCLV
jgi:Fe-S-cluster-containing hydrogenase component 2